MRLRRPLLAAATTAASVAALLVGAAAPGAAATAASTRYAATWTFHGDGVTGSAGAAGGLQLTDYSGTTYYDRVTGSHAGGNLSVGDALCGTASNAPTGVSLYGAQTDWAQMPVLSTQGARVNVNCVIDGASHRFHWGNHGTSNGGYDSRKTTNCVTLTRTAVDTFTLTTAAAGDRSGCAVTQDVVYDSRLRQVGDEKLVLIPFTATVTVPGLK